MHPAVRRLIAQRADPDYLYRHMRDHPPPDLWRSLESLESSEGLSWRLGPELARDGDTIEYLAQYDSFYEGTHVVVFPVRPGELVERDGKYMFTKDIDNPEFYEPGADVVMLRAAGMRLSWPAAQWLYEAARVELDEIHHANGNLHGRLRARRVRLALFHRSYSERDRDDAPPPPILLVRCATMGGSDAERAFEREMLALAIAGLTTHPDPTIDRLLHDPAGADVLRDLLLQRGQPVEQMLLDRAYLSDVATPLADDKSIDDELCDLWNHVLRLEPMIDTSDPAIFELPGPDLD